ncbi:MAG: hypothetical protein LIO95_06240 [Clostridiales bacterium]|nr:hypothetical protein [Clostridiales bacterium]
MDETCRLRRGEGYEVHDDEAEGFHLNPQNAAPAHTVFLWCAPGLSAFI